MEIKDVETEEMGMEEMVTKETGMEEMVTKETEKARASGKSISMQGNM
jgi:hypothetical protein